jgi:hypothetical protein
VRGLIHHKQEVRDRRFVTLVVLYRISQKGIDIVRARPNAVLLLRIESGGIYLS